MCKEIEHNTPFYTNPKREAQYPKDSGPKRVKNNTNTNPNPNTVNQRNTHTDPRCSLLIPNFGETGSAFGSTPWKKRMVR